MLTIKSKHLESGCLSLITRGIKSMTKSKITAKIVIDIENNDIKSCGVGVDIDNEKCRDIMTILFLQHLKYILGQHAQPVVYSALELARLSEKLTCCECDDD